MKTILLGLAIMMAGGLAAWLRGRQPRVAAGLAMGGLWLGSALILAAAVNNLRTGALETWRMAWTLPYGSLSLCLDSLSSFFLCPILLLPSLAALQGAGYLNRRQGGSGAGAHWFFYNTLVAGMAVVVLARNAFLFLFAWEVMSLAAFFLVTCEDEKESVREAGWIYLVAAHLGVAFLFAFFLALGAKTGSLDFDRWQGGAAMAGGGAIYLLAIIGFGAKAGFMPFHVWMPETYPEAPGHVAAVMSGVMSKTAIYGLLRAMELTGPLPDWIAWLVLFIGLSTGILGVLFGLAQHDCKRLLAYSSVENLGIVAIGMGMGLLGLSRQAPALAILGFAGCLLHVVNHACYKGLLFMSAGAALQDAASRDMNRLGGLMKRMPLTGGAFAVGAVAIAGLPPFNGFVSEFLLFAGAYRGGATLSGETATLCLAVIAGLALIGGLAAVCFTKVFGMVFLGEPRSEAAGQAREPEAIMRWPLYLLAAACLGIGLAAPYAVRWLLPVVAGVTGYGNDLLQRETGPFLALLPRLTLAGLAFLFFFICFGSLRRWILLGRSVERTDTWGCGYPQPTARIQYTASSYTQPVSFLFGWLLGTKHRRRAPEGLFPRQASYASETPDICHGNLYHPAFIRLNWGLAKLRWLQHGKVQLYVLYVAVTLVALLVWKLSA